MNTITAPLPPVAAPPVSKPWYREPYVWFVLSFPIASVFLGFSLLYAAIGIAKIDPVLDRVPQSSSSIQIDQDLLDRLSPEQRTQIQLSVMPAREGRNHVNTPDLRKNKD
jgi:hypothetical protein